MPASKVSAKVQAGKATKKVAGKASKNVQKVWQMYDENGNLYNVALPHDDFFEQVSNYGKVKAKQNTKKKGASIPAPKGIKKTALTKRSKVAALEAESDEEVFIQAPVSKKGKVSSKKAKTSVSLSKVLADSDDESVSVEDHAAAEALSPEQLKEKRDKELQKKFNACLKFVKKYRREVLNPRKRAALTPVQRLINDLNGVCTIKSRYLGLLKADLSKNPHLTKAIEPLRTTGENKFSEIISAVEELEETDQVSFWKAHCRNRGVDSFLNLVTKKAANEGGVTTVEGENEANAVVDQIIQDATSDLCEQVVEDVQQQEEEQQAEEGEQQEQDQEQEETQVEAADEMETEQEQ